MTFDWFFFHSPCPLLLAQTKQGISQNRIAPAIAFLEGVSEEVK